MNKIWHIMQVNKWLLLMAVASLALSLASGWTTYDGMTNLVRVPLICFLVTFGVQGLMLASSWLIGEQLAHNSSVRSSIFKNEGDIPSDQTTGKNSALSTIVLFPFRLLRALFSWLKRMWYWPVFIFSMCISVFFSYDSLFSTIFPEDERMRAATIRSHTNIQDQMAQLAQKLEAKRLFSLDEIIKSHAWQHYNQSLDQLAGAAKSAPDLVEQHMMAQLQKRQQQLLEHSQTLSQQKTQAATMKIRTSEVESRLNQLKTSRAGDVADIEQLRLQLDKIQKELDEKSAEALAESKGIGTTGITGKGPKYRALIQEQIKLEARRDVARQRFDVAEQNLQAKDKELQRLTGELSVLRADIAKAEGSAEIASKMVESEKKKEAELSDLSSSTASIQGFEDTRAQFEKQPSGVNFQNIVTACVSLQHGLLSVPQLQGKVGQISCEPGGLKELMVPVLSLEQGAKTLKAKCAPQAFSGKQALDALLDQGGECISLSGLTRADAAQFRSSLKRLELNRDDKAHNFVVTLNALQDGNWLAFLALGIALAIDALVFLSGLVGASSVSNQGRVNPDELMAMCLGIDVQPQETDDDDVRNAKIFLKHCGGPSYKNGYVTMIDTAKINSLEKGIVERVLSTGGAWVQTDEHDPNISHVKRVFFEKLAKTVHEGKVKNKQLTGDIAANWQKRAGKRHAQSYNRPVLKQMAEDFSSHFGKSVNDLNETHQSELKRFIDQHKSKKIIKVAEGAKPLNMRPPANRNDQKKNSS